MRDSIVYRSGESSNSGKSPSALSVESGRGSGSEQASPSALESHISPMNPTPSSVPLGSDRRSLSERASPFVSLGSGSPRALSEPVRAASQPVRAAVSEPMPREQKPESLSEKHRLWRAVLLRALNKTKTNGEDMSDYEETRNRISKIGRAHV